MRALVLLIALFLPTVALAQDPPIKDEPPGVDKIVRLDKGKPAPFSGQLYEPATSLRWLHWLQQYKMRLPLDVHREQEICKVKIEGEKKIILAEKERSKKVEKDLKVRLLRAEKARIVAEEEARNPPWYRTRIFGVGIGVVGTLGVTAVVVQAFSSGK